MTPLAGLRRHWGWLLASGLLGILVGVIALSWPGITLLSLAIVLGIGLLVQGGAEFAAGLESFPGAGGRGWTIVFGLLALAAGVICLASPATSLLVIAIGVAFWFFSAGVNEFAAASMLNEHRALNLTLGVLDLVAGVVVVAQPGAGLSAAAVVTGLAFLVLGVAQVVAAVQLRRLVEA